MSDITKPYKGGWARYKNDKLYYAIYPLAKGLAVEQRGNDKEVIPCPAQYAKDFALFWLLKNHSDLLPFSYGSKFFHIESGLYAPSQDHTCDPATWLLEFTGPSRCNRGHNHPVEELIADIQAINFWVYDEEKANILREKYGFWMKSDTTKRVPMVQLDAEELEMGE